MERGKVSISEAVFDDDQKTSKGKRVSEKNSKA